MTANLVDIEKNIQKYHYLSNEQKIERSKKLNKTESVLREYYREKSDNRINHLIRVAGYISEWRFDYDMVMAAMLHELDTEVVKKLFGENESKEIVVIIENYKTLKIRLYKTYNRNDKYTSTVELHNEIDFHALYILIADMMDELENNYTVDKSNFVRDVLIPQVEKIDALHKADVLGDILFKNENRENYDRIKAKIEQINKYGGKYQEKMILRMHQKLDPNSKVINKELMHQQKYIKTFIHEERTVNSIYRYLHRAFSNINNDFDVNVLRTKVAIYDLTLIVDDSIKYDNGNSHFKVFWDFYIHELKDIGISIINFGATDRNETSYFILSDTLNNIYRCFIRTETEYLYYQYGFIIDKNKFSALVQSNGKKIKVFMKDGSAMYIDENATVLDFAFAIHTDLGLKFKCAMKNNNKDQLQPFAKLEPGDTIEIIDESFITAKIKWFRYAKTSLAIYHLTRYFEEQLKNAGLDSLV